MLQAGAAAARPGACCHLTTGACQGTQAAGGKARWALGLPRWLPSSPLPLTLLNDFMVFSSVNDLVIHCWAPLSWSSPLISTKLISSLPRFLLPCSRLNWKRRKMQEGIWGGPGCG